MCTLYDPKTPGYLMIMGAFLAGFLGALALPWLIVSYWYGKADWGRYYREYELAPADRWSDLVKANLIGLLLFSIPLVGISMGPAMVNVWYAQGLKVAASHAGMTL